MKYIYTSNQCLKCDNLKNKYNEFNIPYIERIAERMKAPEDAIDQAALIQASMQNMELPVVVDV